MIKINLLPQKELKKPTRAVELGDLRSILIKMAIPFVISLFLIGSIYFYMEKTKSDLEKDIENNKRIFAQLQQKIEELRKIEVLNKEIETKTKILEDLKKMQATPVILLNTISKKLPEGVWLTGLSYDDRKVSVEGMAFSNLNIVAFVENLKSEINFQDVNLVESQQTEFDKVPVYKFVVKFNLKG